MYAVHIPDLKLNHFTVPVSPRFTMIGSSRRRRPRSLDSSLEPPPSLTFIFSTPLEMFYMTIYDTELEGVL